MPGKPYQVQKFLKIRDENPRKNQATREKDREKDKEND
jgi:hypothetical protein